jgi:hypothetical protein
VQRCRGDSVVLSLRRLRASPLTTPGVLLPPLGAPVIPSRGAIKGNWDMKTARRTTTWLAARPETGLIQLVDVDAP